MSVNKFKFVSPGVFINEIDNTLIGGGSRGIGPVVIGRAERGPSMRPVTVTSFSEFVEIFGSPIPGLESGDVWRNGNRTAPTYGAYAAQAWLRNASPLTYIRLLGTQHDDAEADGQAGWSTESAYGLFIGKTSVSQTSPAPRVRITAFGHNEFLAFEEEVPVTIEFSEPVDFVPNGNNIVIVGGVIVPQGTPAEYYVVTEVAGQVTQVEFTLKRTTEWTTQEISVKVPKESYSDSQDKSGVVDVKLVFRGVELENPDNISGGNEVAPLNHSTGEKDSEGVLLPLVSTGIPAASLKMTLAAVIYSDADEDDIGLYGKSFADDAVTVNGEANKFVKLQGTSGEVKIGIGNEKFSVNFERGSKKYIRNVLNTNPTLLDESRGDNKKTYFLGESYDSSFAGTFASDSDKSLPGVSNGAAIIMKLDSANPILDKHDQQLEAKQPSTGWIFSQHTASYDNHMVDKTTGQYKSGVTRLFRVEGINDGAWASSNLKIEIGNIKAPDRDFNKFGSFSLSIRRTSDSDQMPQIVESYVGLNLNPASPDYIARRIGDMDSVWDYTESRYKVFGQYPNVSNFIRIVMNPDVDSGITEPGLVPFGFEGPPVPRSFRYSFDDEEFTFFSAEGPDDEVYDPQYSIVSPAIGGQPLVLDLGGTSNVTLAEFIMLSSTCRINTTEYGSPSPDTAVFGITSNEPPKTLMDPSYGEVLHIWSKDGSYESQKGNERIIFRSSVRSAGCYDKSKDIAAFSGNNEIPSLIDCRSAAGDLEGYGIVPNFTLDDLMWKLTTSAGNIVRSNKHAEWVPGSRYAGASISRNDFRETLNAGFNSFCVPLVGGSDGINIKVREPFSNVILNKADSGGDQSNELNNYAFNSVKRAIENLSDPEVVECNLVAMPGITNPGLTELLLNICERRGDCLSIMDLENDYIPNTESSEEERLRLPKVREAVDSLKNRRINSSYGCAYFPWVQIRDVLSDTSLWAPPSVVALGTMASSQAKTELWFAPAGFNRGGLTEGSAGLPVSQVRYKLSSKERDLLYEANINPIASFPSEGIVIFGQKTLQVTPSALDRINVRRLMIYLKKEISRVATTILFDQNVSATWQRFTSQVNPFLASVQSRFGLTEFRVVLDDRTTTPDLVDRNIVYAKIMLKPARSIEFIALDFVITKSGASFED